MMGTSGLSGDPLSPLTHPPMPQQPLGLFPYRRITPHFTSVYFTPFLFFAAAPLPFKIIPEKPRPKLLSRANEQFAANRSANLPLIPRPPFDRPDCIPCKAEPFRQFHLRKPLFRQGNDFPNLFFRHSPPRVTAPILPMNLPTHADIVDDPTGHPVSFRDCLLTIDRSL